MKKSKKQEFLNMVERKYDCSLIDYLIEVNRDNLSKPALFYRGRTISYAEMFDKSFRFASSMKALGIEKGMEIPMCLSNTPELVYAILGASLIGAKINIFGNVFDQDYIEEIINGTDAKVLFVTDEMYESIKPIIPNTNIQKTVMFSLTDSYPKGGNPYKDVEKRYFERKGMPSFEIKNLTPQYKKDDNKILDLQDFMNLKYSGQLREKSHLNDLFSTTYSSGSTNANRPKAIQHANRSFITMGVAHNGYDTPKMKNLRALAQIPTHSNTDIISCITDTLSQGCTCCLEYIYDQLFFPSSLLINKPNISCATRSFWDKCFKEYDTNSDYKNVKLNFLLVAMSVGEPTSPGEEKFFNKELRKYKAGTDFTAFPIIPMSMAGGGCEMGGIFLNLFKALYEKNPKRIHKKEPKGYSTYRMVEVAVLDSEGHHLKPYEIGKVVVSTPTNMIGYKNNPEENNKVKVHDIYGREWLSCETYGYKDRYDDTHIKGRIKENEIIPPFMIQDEILKDTKNIKSCEVVFVENAIVAYIEKQPGVHISDEKLFGSAFVRVCKTFPESITERIVFKKVGYEEGFPLSECGKRSSSKLEAKGIKDTLRVGVDNSGYTLEDGSAYITSIVNPKIISLISNNMVVKKD